MVGYVSTIDGEWRTACPSCSSGRRPILHIPYDVELLHKLNVERYKLTKTGRLSFNHQTKTHDDRFWDLALAVYASESTKTTRKPIAKNDPITEYDIAGPRKLHRNKPRMCSQPMTKVKRRGNPSTPNTFLRRARCR